MVDEKKTLTKQDLIAAATEKLGITRVEAAALIEQIFDTLKSALASGGKVKLSGFGNFTRRDKKTRIGRNPQTGENTKISARRVVTFHPSSVLRAEVNANELK